MQKVAVIGAGPAGLFSSYFASLKNNKIVIFEKNTAPGKKLLLTGNGRCNISNLNVSSSNYHGSYPKFVESVFSRFTNTDTLDFYKNSGLDLIDDDKGKVYPKTENAEDVLKFLLGLNKNNKILFNSRVLEIKKQNKQFIVKYENSGVVENETFDRVILTTGGKTYPDTGSEGSGYIIAEKLGHSIIKPIPVSTPILSNDSICLRLTGVTITVSVFIYYKDKKVTEANGDMIFTHYGCSGPAIFSVSRDISEMINRRNIKPASLNMFINFSPNINPEEIYSILKVRFVENPEKTISNQFSGIAPKSLIEVILNKNEINLDTLSKYFPLKKINIIIDDIVKFKLNISGISGWNQAQFTAGGVNVKEINSKSMESKIVPGLFFAGEVVDINGDSGGYNLQWAWSSGYLAGSSV